MSSYNLGTTSNRFDEFSENFQKGRGSFPIRKNSFRFFGKGKGGGSLHPEKFCCKMRNIVLKKRGGGQRPFGSFPTIHQIY